jgi:organic hydroperoxide reductase OsmC/OhrA
VSEVTLNPSATYGGDKRPSVEEEERLHHRAHEECFIANSVRTAVTIVRAT